MIKLYHKNHTLSSNLWDTRLWRDFFATLLVGGGIQNQASIAYNRGANLLDVKMPSFCKQKRKFATARFARTRFFTHRFRQCKRRTQRCALHWRKRWDSNPRYREVQLISSQSRYDHFDTLPYSFFANLRTQLL